MAALSPTWPTPDVFFDELIGIFLDHEIQFKQDFGAAMKQQDLTKHQVAKECRVLLSYAYQGILRDLAIEALRNRVISDITNWDVKDAIDLAKWSQSKEGKDAVDLITSCKSKKRKEAITEMEKLQKIKRARAWVSALDIQVANLSADVSSYKADAKVEIDGLTTQKLAIKKRIEDNKETKTLSGVTGCYKPPYPKQVTKQCWEKYIEEHKQAGIPYPPYNENNILIAVRRHEDSVNHEHKAIFCANYSVRDDLERYLKDKIRCLESISSFHLANKYKSMLVDVGCIVNEENPYGVEAGAGRIGPSGHGENHLTSPSILDALKVPSP